MMRILVIDDNDALRSLLRQHLERVGYEVCEAAEGGEALHHFQQQPPDMVLCDLFMAGKEGFETIRELRQSSQVPIIAMSGDGPLPALPLLDVAQKLGADRALHKPFDIETLLDTIRQLRGDIL
jgi:two-component system, OmpR family, response regulator